MSRRPSLPLAALLLATLASQTARSQSATVAPEPALVCESALCDEHEPVEVDLALDYSQVLPGDEDATLMVELRGSELVGMERTPVAMAIVIDASGSMEGDKIAHARRAAADLVDRLSEGDVITIISYNTRARTHLERFVVGADRSRAHEAIAGIETRGNTCVSCGLSAGYTALSDAPTGHLRRLVMLSDGRANRGTTSEEELRFQATTAREVHGVPTSTIGVGADYNEALLSAVATGGSGSYYFLPDAAALTGILDRELAALERTVATGVTVVVTALGGVTLGQSDAVGARWDGSDIVVPVGNLGAGERRRMLVPLQLPPGELAEVAQATVIFDDVVGERGEMASIISMSRTHPGADVDTSANPIVIELMERWASVRDVEAALSLAEGGGVDEATEQLNRRAARLRGAANVTGSTTLALEAEAVQELADALEEEPEAEERRELILQNAARSSEVRQGVDEGSMYHDSTVLH